jgi:hypothetical protein
MADRQRACRWFCVWTVALLLLGGAAAAQAVTTDPGAADYRGAQFVQVQLGATNQEAGLRLVDGQPDGATEADLALGGRRTISGGAGQVRWFYFDVHDSYIYGGKNRVRMTVTYLDVGLTPIYLEYDAYEWWRPDSRTDAVTRKRIVLATRTDSDGWRTAWVELPDARFLGTQPGGADFRIGSPDPLLIHSVAVMLVAHEDYQPVTIIVDGKPVSFSPDDVQPFIHPETHRTLVPLRAMLHALDVPDEGITWHQDQRAVAVTKGQTTIWLPVDSEWAIVNGQPVKLDQPATIVADRMVIPLRFVADQFGYHIEWVEDQRTIILTPVAPAAQEQ